ncbi:MAG: DUF397 domain-containing protein [Micromonosporaceae bacterium]
MRVDGFHTWKKSSRSGSGGDNCVEVSFAPDGTVGVRHSKQPDDALLVFTPDEWAAFITGVKDDEFDR